MNTSSAFQGIYLRFDLGTSATSMTDSLCPSAPKHQPQESLLARRPKRRLNPILEEESDDGKSLEDATGSGRPADPSQLKIKAWLSPMSDHFPTPRGNNYLPAPILPSSPSTDSAEGNSQTTSSQHWNRDSIWTENTEFDDLYDVSDDGDDVPHGLGRSSSSLRKAQLTAVKPSNPKQPPPLTIPATREMSGSWSAAEDLKKIGSPIPLTPSAQLTMSPAQLTFMDKRQAEMVPTISAPPSLDGSLTSDQLTPMSAPATPVTRDEDDGTDEDWAGVHLQPAAMETLHTLANSDDGSSSSHEQPPQILELSQTVSPLTAERGHAGATGLVAETRQHVFRLIPGVNPQGSIARLSSSSPARNSLAGLAKLDIPSPGGFFSGLSPCTRATWHIPSKSPQELPPPTSTTAEQFYRCPWNISASCPPVPAWPESAEGFYRSMQLSSLSSCPVEQVIEVQDEELGDDVPTARPVLRHREPSFSEGAAEASSALGPTPEVEDVPSEIVVDYDPDYARKQQAVALSNLDRTEMWLLAQRAYLRGTGEVMNSMALTTIPEELDEKAEPAAEAGAASSSKGKKVVRFSDVKPTFAPPKRLPYKLLRQDPAHYRAFQGYIVRAQLRDVFVFQLPRFEALQAQRAALRDFHRNQLLGKYQLSVIPMSARKRLSANVARGDDTLVDDPEKLRQEKEFEAMRQMKLPTWHVAATRLLNGGRLITSPVTKRLARLSVVPGAKKGSLRDRARVLDLGGQSTCDWAWHCCLQYPSTKIYTATTKTIRQLSNSNIRGPPNHRQVAVERLARLPFPDGHFDLISARELHSILKFVGENGEDEWESCLRECMRVLKPGGYLEFSLLDSDIMNAGPLGLAKSVEFGFALKTLGYDPNPSKLWLGRLARAGFQAVRRTWICLPLGAKRNIHRPPPPPVKGSTSGQEGKVCRMEAMVMGSTDNIANVCSIVGGWSWERWLLRCEVEKVAGELRLTDTVTTGHAMEEAGNCLVGVHAVMEEGRNCKAAFRMLRGYAMKPERPDEPAAAVIPIALEA